MIFRFCGAESCKNMLHLAPQVKGMVGGDLNSQVRLPEPAGPLCVEFACSPRVCVGSLRVLRLSPTVQRHA